MKRAVILLSLGVFLTVSCEKQEPQVSDEYFKVTVLGKGFDCGNTFVIRFNEEVAELPDSPVKNHYYADNLPEKHKIEGKNIEIQFRFPKEDEMYACTLMGPTYPHIYILEVK